MGVGFHMEYITPVYGLRAIFMGDCGEVKTEGCGWVQLSPLSSEKHSY